LSTIFAQAQSDDIKDMPRSFVVDSLSTDKRVLEIIHVIVGPRPKILQYAQ